MKPTQEQVIAWAREAGFDWSGKEISWEGVICTNELQTAFTLAYEAGRKDENDACAKVCEDGVANAADWDSSYWDQACENRADAIRARREQ